ncbi:MAG: 2-oxoacid:acceptor oxidoreductase family protein [Desulfobacterales bacterium]|nr:2-oxoacid:acceptor oxidoreductase family protein [Desulfobacterales bacterium]
MIVAGVGGQGGMFLIKILIEAAMIAGVKVSTSEIHGLSQRGGTVYAGITFGENTFGFVEEGQADFLLGLEALEAQRCIPFIHTGTKAVIDSIKILPFSVNAGMAQYPDSEAFIRHLEKNIEKVIYIKHELKGVNPLTRNIYVLGRATRFDDFPLPPDAIEKAIEKVSKPAFREANVNLFRKGRTDD